MAEDAHQESLSLDGLHKEVASLREEIKTLWGAVTALAERVAEATGVEEIIRRARAGSRLDE